MPLPYYKRFPRDFLEGTVGLSLEEKGAYGIVIDLIFMRDGRLEDDARYIAGQLGCSVRKWAQLRDFLIGRGKLQAIAGIISNSRANYLIEEQRSYQDKQAENGSKPKKNKALPKRSVKPKANQSESEPEDTSSNDEVARETNTKGAKRCPEGWRIPPELVVELTVAAYSPGQIERELARFRAYQFKRPHVDWPDTFREWMEKKRPEGKVTNVHESFAERDARHRRENLERSYAASEGVIDIARRRRGESGDSEASGSFG